jgi:hypothetical protein
MSMLPPQACCALLVSIYLVVAATPCTPTEATDAGPRLLSAALGGGARDGGGDPPERVATLRVKCVCGCCDKPVAGGATSKVGPALKLRAATGPEARIAHAVVRFEERRPVSPCLPIDPVPV